MKVGFIGFGNMGRALAEGFIKGGISPKDITISTRSPKKTADFCSQHAVKVADTNKETASDVDLLFLAIKPHQYKEVLEEIEEVLKQNNPLLVSMAAGLSLKEIDNMTHLSKQGIARIMPNLGSKVGEGMTAVCTNKNADSKKAAFLYLLLNKIGKTTELPEKDFSVFSAIAGCSPAFTFLYIDALAKAAVRYGLQKDTAVEIASQAVLGSAKTVLEQTVSPRDLADQVASPGGVTIEGVLSLEQTGFTASIIQAVDAAVKKDLDLMKKKS